MKLAYVHQGDLVEVNKGGRRMYGPVVEIRDGVVQFEPLCRGISYRHASAPGRSSATGARPAAAARDRPTSPTASSRFRSRASSSRCRSPHDHRRFTTLRGARAAAELLTVEAERAVRVLMRKSPATQRTYQGIYERFASWLAAREGVGEAPVAAFTSEAFVCYLDELEGRCSPATVKKERAALRKLARYLHQLRLIDATVVLMVEIPTVNDSAPARRGLDRASWERVLTVAARPPQPSRGRAARAHRRA